MLNLGLYYDWKVVKQEKVNQQKIICQNYAE